MGCPGKVIIGYDLVFSVCSHNANTGVLSDADSVPTYRIYEDETATPILTGSMTKLDDSNTTGFYTEKIACSHANGFEDGKTYTVYIRATIGRILTAVCYGFKAVAGIVGDVTIIISGDAPIFTFDGRMPQLIIS